MSSDKLPPSFNLLKSSKPGGLLGSFAVTAVVTTGAATPSSSILRRPNSLDNKLNIKKVGDRLLAHAITASSFASSPLKLVPPGKVPRNSIQTAAENPTLSKATSTSTNLKPRKEDTSTRSDGVSNPTDPTSAGTSRSGNSEFFPKATTASDTSRTRSNPLVFPSNNVRSTYCVPAKRTSTTCSDARCLSSACRSPDTESDNEVIDIDSSDLEETSETEKGSQGDSDSSVDDSSAVMLEMFGGNEQDERKPNKRVRRLSIRKQTAKETGQKKSASDLKEFAYDLRFMEYVELKKSGCSKECSFDRKCLSHIENEEMYDIRLSFWGAKEDDPYLPKRRLKNIQTIFSTYGAVKDDRTNKLTFRIREKRGGYRRICEASFLIILGLISGNSASDANNMWKTFKKFHLEGKKLYKSLEEVKREVNSGVRQPSDKLNDATTFLRRLMRLYGDTMPTKEGTNKDGKTVYILPYETVDSLFEEYSWDAKINRKPPAHIAQRTCFSKAYEKLKDEIRLLGCRGSLPTCSICNTAHEMLRNTSKWTEAQREIVLQFLRLHLKQQQTERLQLDATKNECREKDTRGNPKKAFIYADAMTLSRGDTPKEGRKRHSNPGKVISNRLFAVQIISGDVDTMLHVNVDQTIPGGANLAIEIQRLAMQHLADELQKLGKLMPKVFHWQFDNCGENKNKEMMCFASLLVESGYSDAIYISFLVVGHTHCNLDQAFSVIAKKLENSYFVGSPIGMQALYAVAHGGPDRPNIQLLHVHDWKKYFEKIVNTKIKYFQVPHRFKITRHELSGRAICQYMLFSPEDLMTEHWLPIMPDMAGKLAQDDDYKALNVKLHQLASINGLPDLKSYLSLSGDVNKLNVNASGDVGKTLVALNQVYPDLLELERRALALQFKGFEIAAEYGNDYQVLPSQQSLADLKTQLQREMSKEATQSKGFIIWLDFKRVKENAVDLFARPDILPHLPDKVSGDHTGKTKQLIDALRITSSVASAMVSAVRGGTMDCSKNPYKSIPDVNDDFKKRILSHQENLWYEDRDSCEKVLDILRMSQNEELSKPWELLRLPRYDESKIDKENCSEQAAIFEALRICQEKLIRKRQGILAAEVIAREGFNPDDAVSVKCIFGFEMDDDGCLEDAKYRCDTCAALCCDLHQEHSRHNDMASKEKILRQHIAYQSLDQTKNKTKHRSIAEVPVASSSPEPLEPRIETAATPLLTAPRRDTKVDLLNRYRALMNHDWNGNDKITVASLKKLVRDLEAQKKGGVNPLPAAITIATTTSDQQQQASAVLAGDSSIKNSKKRKKPKEKVKNNGSAGSDDDIDSYSSSNGESSGSNASSDGEVDPSALLIELKKLLTNTLKKKK